MTRRGRECSAGVVEKNKSGTDLLVGREIGYNPRFDFLPVAYFSVSGCRKIS